MIKFLQETWELAYWALYRPSKLQERMNQWAPADKENENTNSWHILLFRANSRFIMQFFLLILFLTLPLIITISLQGQPLDWLLIPSILLTTYSLSVWFIPITLPIPLIWWLVYLSQRSLWVNVVNPLLELILPILPQIGIGLGTGTVLIFITTFLGIKLLKINLTLGRITVVIGGLSSILLVTWLATNNWLFVVLTGILAGLVLISNYNKINDSAERGIAFALVFVVAFAFAIAFAVAFAVAFAGAFAGAFAVAFAFAGAFAVAFAGAFAVAGAFAGAFTGAFTGAFMGAVAVAGIAKLPVLLFLLVAFLISLSLAPAKKHWVGIIAIILLIILGRENLGWQSLFAIPVMLSAYYRILPDYVILATLNILSSLKIPFLPTQQSALKRLENLPPYNTEILWFPLPGHDQILTTAFRENPHETLATLKEITSFNIPSLKITLNKALPQIVADIFTIIKGLPELSAIHSFYQDENLPKTLPSNISNQSFNKGKNILAILFINGFISSTIATIIPATIMLVGNSSIASIIGIITGTFSAGIITSQLANNSSDNRENGKDLKLILPDLSKIAQNISVALPSPAGLRQRQLEKIDKDLLLLLQKIPKLDLTTSAINRWELVIEHWRKLIELETRSNTAIGETSNPFLYGNPLQLIGNELNDVFRGRRQLVDDIMRLILDRNRPTLALYGPRRFGKTSFLLNLPRLLPTDIVPVYLDVQSSSATSDESAFCYNLVKAIAKDSAIQGIKLPAVPTIEEFKERPYFLLENWLETAFLQLGEKRILLNIDEFEKIGEAMESNRLTVNLFNELRHLIQHYDKLAFLFSGVQILSDLGPNWSSYFISVVPVRMGYLEPEEVIDLLTKPTDSFDIQYDPGVVEAVVKLTRCHPYSVQLMGSCLVSQANLNSTKLLTMNLLELAIKDALEKGESYFTNVWKEGTGTNPEEVSMGQDLLLDLAESPTHTLAESDLEQYRRDAPHLLDKVLRRLLKFDVIEKLENSYVFEIPLYEKWVMECAAKSE